MIRNRLARLEKAMKSLGGGTCRLCYGHPVAVLHVEYEPNPHGPGFRATGRRVLHHSYADRITEDLRCRRCGKQACRVHGRVIRGLGATQASHAD